MCESREMELRPWERLQVLLWEGWGSQEVFLPSAFPRLFSSFFLFSSSSLSLFFLTWLYLGFDTHYQPSPTQQTE